MSGCFPYINLLLAVYFVKFGIYPALIIHNFLFLAIPCQLGFVLKKQSQVLVQRNATSEIIEVDVMAACVIGVDVFVGETGGHQ